MKTNKGIEFEYRNIKNRSGLETILIVNLVFLLMMLLVVVMTDAAALLSMVLFFLMFIGNCFASPKNTLKEALYQGSVDELVKEFARLDIEPSSKVGNTYTFKTKSYFALSFTIFVRDMGGSCELYSTNLNSICKLKKKTEAHHGNSPNKYTGNDFKETDIFSYDKKENYNNKVPSNSELNPVIVKK